MRLSFTTVLVVLMAVNFTACGGGSDDTNRSMMGRKGQKPSVGNKGDMGQKGLFSPKGPFSKRGNFGVIDLDKDYQDGFKDALFLDIRNPWEREYKGYPKGSIGGAVYEYRENDGSGNEISEDDGRFKVRKSHKKEYEANFVKKVKEYANGDLNKKIILICASGSRTGAHKGGPKAKDKDSASKLLSQNGFTNVWHIEGGFGAWVDKGFEIIPHSK